VVACAEKGLSGLEPIVGVPGSVGGAVAMNAGTRDGEIGPLVVEVSVVDLAAAQARTLPRSEMTFSYRASSLTDLVLLSATLQLKPGTKVI